MQTKTIRAGLIGAGYIASWHAEALKGVKGVQLTAICDVNKAAATEMAQALGVQAFGSLDEMVAAGACDAVHVLTPPHSHCTLATQSLRAGLHVLVEKPVGVSAAEAALMAEVAAETGKTLAAGHNFLALPAYGRLKAARDSGRLGRIASAEINWRFPLGPLRAGPFNLWLLRAPGNLLLELGPHLYAFAQDLFGPVEILHLDLSLPVDLPGGGTRHQGWRILARAGSVDITFTLSLVEGADDRSVTLRGSSGMARLDFANDTLEIRAENAADIVLNPLIKELSLSWQHLREGTVNATRQLVSLNRKAPYGLSFAGLFSSFYDAVHRGAPIDPRFSMSAATEVMGAIERTLALMPPAALSDPAPPSGRQPQPSVMVIGGTGFIGRHLTRSLVAAGHDVRVLSRGKEGPFADLADHVETVSVSLRDPEGLRRAMAGIDVVYNLAKSTDRSWEDALKNDVAVAVAVAEAALDAGVKRFIYTGTIASYDMSDPSRPITEDTGFGQDMTARNIYARSKAECEARLLALARDKGLPLIIARPGIVIGEGGPLQHWGLGRWHGAGAVRIWGDGRNILPFVLIEDVSDALVKLIDAPGVIGHSFNLIGEPMFSARDYFDAIHDRLGARITVKPGALYGFFLMDRAKYLLKRYALGKKSASFASLQDWRSRAHLSPFVNTRTKERLGWQPESDRQAFVEKAIGTANLLGF